jgi:hypothetical protein
MDVAPDDAKSGNERNGGPGCWLIRATDSIFKQQYTQLRDLAA